MSATAENKDSRRITPQQHKQITRSGVCPGCWDHTIVRRVRYRLDEQSGRPKYSGDYLACGGPHAHECWHMTRSHTAPRLYETFGPKATQKL